MRRRRRRLWCAVGTALALLGGAAGAIVYPHWVSTTINRNESVAIATLKNISSAQSQCQARGAIDLDADGCGEYGFFGELTGAVALRGTGARLVPPVLSDAFANVFAGRVEASGYLFQLFLPGAGAQGIAEDAGGGDPAGDNGVDAGEAELLWCCYAWPQRRGRTGVRAFFVNQRGDVLATTWTEATYDGAGRPCSWWAAFAATASCAMDAAVAANTLGRDGNLWVIVS